MARLRDLDLAKPPGVAEAISWAGRAERARRDQPRPRQRAGRTAGAVLKYSEDLQAVRDSGFAAVAADEP